MIRHLVPSLILAVFASASTYAEEGLLWKATNRKPAQVVPAYGGISSPFPETGLKKEEEVSDTAVLDEQVRLREEAYSYAENIIKSGKALQPDLRNVRIGGILIGNLGSRVLINNQWIGVGEQLKVRQMGTSAALEAIKSLSSMDQGGAGQLSSQLNGALASTPYVGLTLRNITSSSIVLEGSHGTTTLAIPANR